MRARSKRENGALVNWIFELVFLFLFSLNLDPDSTLESTLHTKFSLDATAATVNDVRVDDVGVGPHLLGGKRKNQPPLKV